MENVINMLKKIASRECFYDIEDEDVCVYDYSGGNVDDAFDLGENAGLVMLARQILSMLGETW